MKHLLSSRDKIIKGEINKKKAFIRKKNRETKKDNKSKQIKLI